MRARRAAALAAALLGVALLVSDCAKRGLPPGGPEDTTPPVVSSLGPASGSVNVDPAADIRIAFSEPMIHRTVETSVFVSPPPGMWRKRYWQGDTYILVPGQRLLDETTYLVSVGTSSTDRHGLKLAKTFVAGFSTGPTIEAGVISGKILWKSGTVTVEQALVEVFDVADVGESTFVFPTAAPVYVTYTGSGGAYEIPYVAVNRIYKMFGLVDKNANGQYDKGETIGCAEGDVSLADSTRAAGVDIVLCGEVLGGEVDGLVELKPPADTTIDVASIKIAVEARPVADTTGPYNVPCDKKGNFSITCMREGRYAIQAYWDKNGNGRKDLEDSLYVRFPDTLAVEPCARPQRAEMSLEVD